MKTTTRRELIDFYVERSRAVIRRQGKALTTERDYCGWLRRYLTFTFTLPPTLTSEAKAEAFLTMLVMQHDVAVATQNSAFSAILFFYKDVLRQPLKDVDALRASRPAQMRHAPSKEETRTLLAEVRDVSGYPTRHCFRYNSASDESDRADALRLRAARDGTVEPAHQRCEV